MPIRPTTPEGSPGLRVISRHVSPPSVDLKRPLPGPPLDIWYSIRYASHSAANITLGLRRSICTSTAPVLLSRNSLRCQVVPPSLRLQTHRPGRMSPGVRHPPSREKTPLGRVATPATAPTEALLIWPS